MAFKWDGYEKKPTTFIGYAGWLYYLFCLYTGLYMLDQWERTVFNASVIILLSMSIYTGYIFLPQHINAMLAHFGYFNSV